MRNPRAAAGFFSFGADLLSRGYIHFDRSVDAFFGIHGKLQRNFLAGGQVLHQVTLIGMRLLFIAGAQGCLNTGRIGVSKRELAKLKEFVGKQMKDGKSLIDDVRFRDKLSKVEIELMALEITNLRFLDQMRRTGQPPGADVSMLKIKGTEIQQSLTELMMQAVGPMAQPFKPVDHADAFDAFTASLAPRYANTRKTTIYAGSNEIQRNIISKMSLGL